MQKLIMSVFLAALLAGSLAGCAAMRPENTPMGAHPELDDQEQAVKDALKNGTAGKG